MKSSRGFLAAVLFLSALPVAALLQGLLGRGGEIALHFTIAIGSGLLCSAISAFRTPWWATWVGYLSTGSLALIFALQGTSQLLASEVLARVAFQGLGQEVEGWLLNGLILWCLVALMTDGHAKTRVVGLLAVSLAAGVRFYAALLSWRGASLETTAPLLKVLYLMPFVWLLFASWGRPQLKRDQPIG